MRLALLVMILLGCSKTGSKGTATLAACAELTPEVCATRSDCGVISGTNLETKEKVDIGCMKGGAGCDAALGCWVKDGTTSPLIYTTELCYPKGYDLIQCPAG